MTLKNKKLLSATLALMSVGMLTNYNRAEASDVTVNEDSYTKNETTSEHTGDYNIIYGGNINSAEDLTSNFNIGPSNRNNITVNSGKITGGVLGGFVYFPYNFSGSVGDVYGNRVIIDGGTVSYVSGGEVAYYYSGSGTNFDFAQPNFYGGNVYNNSVDVYGGKITGGIVGGSALTSSAYENFVNIHGGTVSSEVVGGEVRYAIDGSAIHDNAINISGGTVSGNVIAAKIDNSVANVPVENNSINIYGSPNLSGANLIGVSGSNYTSANNSLNIYTYGITAQNILNFDKINFFDVQNASRILTLTGGVTNLGLDKINMAMHGSSPLTTGDKISVIYNSNGLDVSSTNYNGLAQSADVVGGTSYDGGTITRGSTAVYGMNLATSADGTELTATVGDLIGDTGNPIPESAREFAYLPIDVPDPFTDMMTEKIVDEFSTESSSAEDTLDIHEASGFNIFINAGGGKIKTKTGTGTWTTTKRGNFDFGLARSLDSKAGTWFIAPIFEYAHGSYDSQLPNGIRGNGMTKYTAGGFIARRLNRNGFYYEASLRGGRAESEFASNDFLIAGEKSRVTYDMSTPVFASHIRLGVAKKFNANNLLDIYGIYSYAHQGSMDSDLSSGEHVDFSSVHAQKVRIGYRFTTRTSAISRVYTGLAWQYESTSGATATALDYNKHSDGSKGSSGMLELGWQIKPNMNNPWLLDINATGWVGYNRGFNAMLRMQRSI